MPFFKPKCKACGRPLEGISPIIQYRNTKGKIFQFCSERCGTTYQKYIEYAKGEYLVKVGGFLDSLNSIMDSTSSKISSFNNIVTGLNDFLDGLNGK